MYTVTDISTLMNKGMYMDITLLRNVHGQNITKVKLCANFVETVTSSDYPKRPR